MVKLVTSFVAFSFRFLELPPACETVTKDRRLFDVSLSFIFYPHPRFSLAGRIFVCVQKRFSYKRAFNGKSAKAEATKSIAIKSIHILFSSTDSLSAGL